LIADWNIETQASARLKSRGSGSSRTVRKKGEQTYLEVKEVEKPWETKKNKDQKAMGKERWTLQLQSTGRGGTRTIRTGSKLIEGWEYHIGVRQIGHRKNLFKRGRKKILFTAKGHKLVGQWRPPACRDTYCRHTTAGFLSNGGKGGMPLIGGYSENEPASLGA